MLTGPRVPPPIDHPTRQALTKRKLAKVNEGVRDVYI